MKKKYFLFALCFLLASPVVKAVEPAPDSCEDALTEKWVSMLSDLKRVETFFVESKWQYLKYWETVYNPLWQAEIEKNDHLSEKRKAQGEISFTRYQRQAEDTLSLAEEARAALLEHLTSLRKSVKAIRSCCTGHDYRRCMAPRTFDIVDRAENLEKMLALRKSTEVEFSARVRASLNDRPSDHDDFSSRYQSYLEDLEIMGGVKFLKLIRDLREALEINWPGQKCCELCKPVSTDLSQDAVLNRLKLDDQGPTGATGRVVNNVNIVKAFEEFEKSKKKKR